jgi:hypothetical protein
VGIIRIETWGSFPRETEHFHAQRSGHAVAVQNAIRWLQDRLPAAVAQDKKLRDSGQKPDDGFAEADKREIFSEESDKRTPRACDLGDGERTPRACDLGDGA